MGTAIYIAIIVAVVVIRLIIKAVKATTNTTTPYKPIPPYNNPSMKQPPPYVAPSEQTPTDFSNLFDEQTPTYQQNNPFKQNTSPFNNSPPPPSFKDPFDEKQDAFSNIPNHNTQSNMGVGSRNYYCMYCGKKFQSTATLRMDTCFKHPKSDQGLQKHVLYTGAGKPNIGF